MAARPGGITVLSVFFVFAAAMAAACAIALSFPSSIHEPMWRMKPEAGEALKRLGFPAIALLTAVAAACAGAAIGLWRRARWGHRLAIGVLVVNLVGDALNAIVGGDPRAWIGVPIGGLLLAYLGSSGVRGHFATVQSR